MKKNKGILGFIIFVFICNFLSSCIAASLEENTKEFDSSIESAAVLIMEETTGKVVYEKNGHERRYPASTTKIMTAILAIENCDLDDTATASEYAVTSIPSGYTNANIQVGEVLSVRDLLYVLMVCSANESAIILAEKVAGSEEEFCWMMNEKAKEIGCEDTHFVNPNGIHNDDHYTTAYDLALMAQYGMENETFREIVSTTSYTLPSTNAYPSEDRTFTNTNSLILFDNRDRADNYYYQYATGIKTGYTTDAKNCLVSSATKNGMSFINVVLGASVTYGDTGTISHRYLDSINGFNFAFDNYSFRKIKDENTLVDTITIENGKKNENSLNLNIASEVTALVSIDNKNTELEPEIILNEGLAAPISEGDVVGTITYKVEGLKYTADLVAANDVEEMTVLDVQKISTIAGIALVLFIIIVFFVRGVNKRKKYLKNRNKYI